MSVLMKCMIKDFLKISIDCFCVYKNKNGDYTVFKRSEVV